MNIFNIYIAYQIRIKSQRKLKIEEFYREFYVDDYEDDYSGRPTVYFINNPNATSDEDIAYKFKIGWIVYLTLAKLYGGRTEGSDNIIFDNMNNCRAFYDTLKNYIWTKDV